ncbi:MAG: tyrosine-type recombinase/integrase [Desulfobacterales bacterium]|jgi:site-specific recombinase XerD
MTDSLIQQCTQWLEWYSQQYGPSQKDPAAVGRLIRATVDYLDWMKSVNYSIDAQHLHRRQLELFLDFVKNRRLPWQQLFTVNTRKHFKKINGLATTAAINGLSRYLVKQGLIKTPLPQHPKQRKLIGTFEDYLQFRQDGHQTDTHQLVAIRRVLSALCDYLNRQDIILHQLRIEDLDAFMAEFCQPFLPGTCRIYRTIVRGFLTYLHLQRGILKKDLAPLLIGAPQFAKAKPPKFLRPHEVELLFDSLSVSSAKDLRTYVMVHLAYTLGLRPCEICRITLDDIAFKKAQLSLEDRKTTQPLMLPIPEKTLKAIVVYIVGGRPNSDDRHLILSLAAPYGPIVAGLVGHYIQQAMHKAGLNSTPYWLRHSYAQHLLSSGASIYEIKQMLGHRHIESSRKYLHIHTDLMREVILDEPL